ncbi:MAG: T9SS type A sorting domain-containing protein, partial [Bacteroidales bacterium]|nr:T9SS type A sorting domain-containing protein [Bacteroidales bacterium]
AINCFEDIVENPDSYEDSIFAIIDLGYTYFLMENSSYKSAYTGKLSQYKFESKEKYNKSRDYHIELLFKNDGQSAINEFADNLGEQKAGELSQNTPNPCSGVTNIYYNLEEATSVNIKVYNHLGMQQKLIEMPYSDTGINKLELNTAELPAGIYFYSLIIDGEVSDTKKMVVVK